jgi:DNA-binding MarR family transcriptional regulator
VLALREIAVVAGRENQIDYVASQLLAHAALLTRLLVRQVGGELSRTELSLLSTLSGAPQRITDLAELEGLAQPTITTLVKQLEQQGLVKRERQTNDGRVVLVNLTEAGRISLEDYRAQTHAALGAYLADMSDQEIDALTAGTEMLAQLITRLQQRPVR